MKAGISGFLLSLVIGLFTQFSLDPVPSFLATLIVIYLFRLGTVKDGLLAALMTYLLSDGVLSTVALASWYFSNQPYPSFAVDVWTLLLPVVTAGSALVAGYLGVWVNHHREPPRGTLPNVPLKTQPA